MMLRVTRPFAVSVAAGALFACLMPIGALAQNPGIQELLNRVDRLQRELTTLQRQVYQGKAPPAATGQPVPAAPAPPDPRTAARHSIRIAQLEGEISRLTGKLEEFDFTLRRIEGRLDKLVVDLDQRLTALEGGAPPPASAEPPPLASPNANLPLRPSWPSEPTTAAPPPAPPAGTVPPPPGVLGTIPKDLAVTKPRGPANVPTAPPPASATPPATASEAPSQPPASLPPGTPQSQYDYALSLMLKQQDFARAEQALRAFVRQHPQDKLTGNAQYWLGETYYVRQSYQDAAFAFAEGYQRYPKSGKAPDSLLKLGMSLSRMAKPREACTAFSRFLSKYPKANARLKARIDRERRKAKCR